jgi:hypothetical protein
MKDQLVKSFEDFHALTRKLLHSRAWLYRGQNSVDWRLVPKIGRPEYQKVDRKNFFSSFKRRAVEFTTIRPEDDWDWMVLGQHHGLPTQLLDWTFNPLVAAFFAVFPYKDEDCIVYAFKAFHYLDTAVKKPNEFKGVIRIFPRGIAARIARQGGAFTYHNSPDLALEGALEKANELIRIVISKKYRKEMIYELDKYCINQMTLFPDLDRLSRYLAWSAHSDIRSFWTKKK